MKCPKCGIDDNIVIDTREREKYHKRIRQCVNCGNVFATREEYVDSGYNHKSVDGAPKWLDSEARKPNKVDWNAIRNNRNAKLQMINERIKNVRNEEK